MVLVTKAHGCVRFQCWLLGDMVEYAVVLVIEGHG